jgi:hypothetical protein
MIYRNEKKKFNDDVYYMKKEDFTLICFQSILIAMEMCSQHNARWDVIMMEVEL